jgi:hypothetical protein
LISKAIDGARASPSMTRFTRALTSFALRGVSPTWKELPFDDVYTKLGVYIGGVIGRISKSLIIFAGFHGLSPTASYA